MSLNKVDKDIMMLNKAANVNSNVRKLTNILNALVTAIKQGIDPNYTTYVNKVVTEAVEAEHLTTQNAISQQNKEIDDFKEAVTDQVNSYQPVVIEGDVTNAPDEEDLTSENNLLKLKNRSALNGMGYVILRRGASFASQVTTSNTIYEVRYNFDLDGASVTIPAGCTLKFDGGSIINGTINFNQTKLEGRNIKIYSSISGTILGPAYIDWFCETSNISLRLGELADCCKTILFYAKDYSINNFTKVNGDVSLIGDSKKTNIHLIPPTEPIISGTRTVYACLCLGATREWVGSIRDITFTIDANVNPITDPIHIGKMHDCLFYNCEFIQIGGYKNAFLCRKADTVFSSFSTDSYNVIIDTCIFRQAIIQGESNESIGFVRTNNVLVTNCQFYKMTDDLGFHRCHDLTICNNYLDAYDGRITTNNCWNVKIYSNTIEYNYGVFGQGIFADYEYATTDNELNNYQIYNNTIDFSKAADTDTYGIRIECVTNAYIHDNVIIPKKRLDNTLCKTSISIDYYAAHNKTYISDIHIFNNLVGSIRIDYHLEGGSNFCIKNNTLTGELYVPELLNATIYENYILGYKVAGTTLERPQYDLLETKRSFAGNCYFDTDLGKTIYWSGTKWVDATGADIPS